MLIDPIHFRIIVMFLLFWACAKPCELDLLQQAQTTADISAACDFPSPEKRRLSCGDGTQPADYDGLYALHNSCNLNVIASVDEFAALTGGSASCRMEL